MYNHKRAKTCYKFHNSLSKTEAKMTKNSILAKYINTGVALLLMVCVPVLFIISSAGLQGGAGMFPLLMCGIMLFCAVMSFYCKFRRREPLVTQNPPSISFPRLILLSALLFCFIPLSDFLGFYATSFVCIIAGFLYLAGSLKAKYLAQALVVAGVFVVAEKLIFYDLLTILTPTGLLF